MKGWGKLSNLSVKRPEKANRYIYGSEKVEKKNFFVIYSYLKVGEFTAVKRGAKFLIRYVKGVHC